MTAKKLPEKTGIRKTFSSAQRIALGIAAIFLLLCGALLVLRPYARLGQLARKLVKNYAPAGTTVNGISVSFPSTIVLTNLVLPVRVNDQQRQVRVEKVSGKISILSLLKGMVNAEMNSDFFGGLLWVKFRTEPRQSASPVAFEARARKLDISQLCNFFRAPVTASGRCDLDVDAEVDEHDIRRLNGQALAIGNHIEVPPLDFENFSLPRSRDTEFHAKLSAVNGKVLIESFRFAGTAYDLSGHGEIILSEPLEQSQVDCSASGIFKERFSVSDERLKGAQEIVDTVVTTQSELFFKIGGTIGKPDVQLDAASSLGSLMQRLNH